MMENLSAKLGMNIPTLQISLGRTELFLTTTPPPANMEPPNFTRDANFMNDPAYTFFQSYVSTFTGGVFYPNKLNFDQYYYALHFMSSNLTEIARDMLPTQGGLCHAVYYLLDSPILTAFEMGFHAAGPFSVPASLGLFPDPTDIDESVADDEPLFADAPVLETTDTADEESRIPEDGAGAVTAADHEKDPDEADARQ